MVESLRRGDFAAIGRAISVLEDRPELAETLMEKLYPLSGRASVIGVTGSPGAGKSTLVDCLAYNLAAGGKKVAVIAVDPSSPFTGGAVLGDRVRMNSSTGLGAEDGGKIFIRSMATRGALGGIAPVTGDAVVALDAAGFDAVIVETVGVGQAEVEIIKTCDTVVVVLVPGMGDTVQALKAGIMEIADIFAINKADHDGADRLEKEVRSVIAMAENTVAENLSGDSDLKWTAPIVQTVATEKKGVGKLVDEISHHLEWGKKTGKLAERKRLFLGEMLKRKLGEKLISEFLSLPDAGALIDNGIKTLVLRKKSPAAVADEILAAAKKKV